MAKKKTAKRGAKQVAKKKAAKRPVKKKAANRKKSAPKRKPAKRAASKPAAAPAMSAPRIGLVTHTELASSDPAATKRWCEKVLRWQFMPPMPTEAGPYHMWRSANDTGGGIRANNPPEMPGTIPYVEVASIRATFDSALDAGATEMVPPTPLPGGMGWIAIVMAPGGMAIGFWSTR